MKPTFSSSAFLLGIVLSVSGAATCEPCDTPREPWMDTLKSSGIKGVGITVSFDLFADGHLVVNIKDVQYYNSYAMNGHSRVNRDPRQSPDAVENQLRDAAEKAMQEPLRKLLSEKHVSQGRGEFWYPLFDAPCRTAALFEPRVFGPTPLAISPVGKRLAVMSEVAAIRVVDGKDQTQVDIATDDGWFYTCRRTHSTTSPFRNGENVAVSESNGYLTIESLEPNVHRVRLKIVQKTRLGYL